LKNSNTKLATTYATNAPTKTRAAVRRIHVGRTLPLASVTATLCLGCRVRALHSGRSGSFHRLLLEQREPDVDGGSNEEPEPNRRRRAES
jgi:hypothetical protein